MTYAYLLVPIDGTPLAGNIVEGAVALARGLNARICFLHVVADFGATDEGALLHAAAPGVFAQAVRGNARLLLEKAEAAARARGLDARTVYAVGDRPHEVILETARTQGCDLIYLSSHGRRGFKAMWHASVVQRLLEQTTLPILVAEVERNKQPSDAQRALSAIRDEHRSLAAVIHALQRATQDAGMPDFRLLRAMLYYIEHFPERLHHPKEEAYLFRKLAERTHDCNAVIAQLRQQHSDGAKLFAALRAALVEYEAGSMVGARFCELIEDFATSQWEHMHAEENVILPSALSYLTAQDWTEIAGAFLDNKDPRFGRDVDEPFSDLCARVLSLASDTSAT